MIVSFLILISVILLSFEEISMKHVITIKIIAFGLKNCSRSLLYLTGIVEIKVASL